MSAPVTAFPLTLKDATEVPETTTVRRKADFATAIRTAVVNRTRSSLTKVGSSSSINTRGTTSTSADAQEIMRMRSVRPSSSQPVDYKSRCYYRFAIREDSLFRQIWTGLLGIMLVYVATLLPFRACFLEVHVPNMWEVSLFWVIAGHVIDAFFWMDLGLHFFFTFRDKNEREVESLSRIARRYLTTTFVVDLISCLPAQLFEVLSEAFVESEQNTPARLKRLPRIFKLLRLFRIAKVFAFVWNSEQWERLRGFTVVRVANIFISFFFVAHLLACGWYLVAAVHDELEATWIYRRDSDGANILSEDPLHQWVHCIYFVVTVFTTVGFGDMSAYTSGEMIYIIFVMLIGATVNAIITGEVINAISNSDVAAKQRKEQTMLMRAFAKQTQLDEAVALQLQRFLSSSRNMLQTGNREQVEQLILKNVFPRRLEGELPGALFKGKLIRNQFFKGCGEHLPIRLPLIIAIKVVQHIWLKGDLVYCAGDQPSSIHLVLSGCFAAVVNRRHDSRHMTSHSSQQPEGREHSGGSALAQGSNSLGQWHHLGLVDPGEVYPFRLFCWANYFGDVEICARNDREVRSHTMRCEADGTTLVLDKHDFAELLADYKTTLLPVYKAAVTRALTWGKRARAVPPYVSHGDLAAFTIQKQYFKSRAHTRKRHSGGATSTNNNNSLAFLLEQAMSETPRKSSGPSKNRRVEWAGSGTSPCSTAETQPSIKASELSTNGLSLHGDRRDLAVEIANLSKQMEEVQSLLQRLASSERTIIV